MVLKVALTILIFQILASNINASEKHIVKARIESCPGCALNRLPEVRKFIYEDVSKYENVEWKKISGAQPEVLFLNENDEEIERHQLGPLTRAECNQLLVDNGFKLKNKEL